MDRDGTDGDDRLHRDDLRLLEQLTESTNDALWMFASDWSELVFVNSAYEDIFGHSTADLRQDPTAFLEVTHPDDRNTVVDAMERLSGGESIDLEFRVDPENGYRTWVWVQGQPITDDSGEIRYFAGYTRDITTLKEYQTQLERHRAELERSNESLREFAYIASHDLQEPLRMVSSYVDLLDQEYGDHLDEEAAEYMEFAVDGARRMKRMIDSLLAYSRVHTEAGDFTEIDVNEVLEDTCKDLELLFDEYDADVAVDELPSIEADRDQIGQVFQNLLKNAVQHASDDGVPEIHVTVSERADAYVFAVSDNGPGIPEDHRTEIFKIFEQGTTSSTADNTGIGLAITKRIIHRHGGDIWVESEPDEGAAFTFTIPRDSQSDLDSSVPEREVNYP